MWLRACPWPTMATCRSGQQACAHTPIFTWLMFMRQKHQRKEFQFFHRIYFTTVHHSKIFTYISNLCYTCKTHRGTVLHLLGSCNLIQTYCSDIHSIIQHVSRIKPVPVLFHWCYLSTSQFVQFIHIRNVFYCYSSLHVCLLLNVNLDSCHHATEEAVLWFLPLGFSYVIVQCLCVGHWTQRVFLQIMVTLANHVLLLFSFP